MPQNTVISSGDSIEVTTGRFYPGQGNEHFIEPTWDAARVALRPLDYAHLGQLLGHYRAISMSGACTLSSAGGILASLRWLDTNAVPRFLVLLRLGVQIEILGAITTAAPFDVASYIFRGATGNASGSGSTTLTLTGNNQKARLGMASSILGSGGGELRTIGTSTTLSAAAGKTNDTAPFGFAAYGTQVAPNVGATANVTAPLAAQVLVMQDLYKLESIYSHPIVLASNEGIEIQQVTAAPGTGSWKYAFLWEWAEVVVF
jgi:hypothetical protein